MLTKANEVRNTPISRDMAAADRSRLGRAKVAAAEVVPILREALYLEPEDG